MQIPFKLSPVFLALALAGCGGETTDSSLPGNSDNPGGLPSPNALSFNLSEAKQVVTTTDSAVQSKAMAQTRSARGQSLNTFVFFESDAEDELQEHKLNALNEAGIKTARDGSVAASGNFFAINELGEAEFAADSPYDYKVSFTVISPDKKYLYVALDSQEFWHSNELVNATDCAIFQVKLEDDTWRCLEPGYAVEAISNEYRRHVSDNKLKPIQFDDEGNLFYLARPLHERHDWNEEVYDDYGNVVDLIEHYSWDIDWESVRGIRKVDTGGNSRYLTSDVDDISSFVMMNNDTLVYSYGNWDNAGVRMVVGASEANPATNELGQGWWSDFFYARDDHQTVIFNQPYSDDGTKAGLNFVQPSQKWQGGIDKRLLDTSPFSADKWNATPRRVILADDGYVYGLFEDNVYDSQTGTDHQYANLYRILPYSTVRKARIDMGTDWWNFWHDGKRDIQLSKGYAYFVESEKHPAYQSRDVIKAVRMVDGKEITLLGDDDWSERYDLSNWKISGDVIYFTGMDKATTRMISGEIDTLALKRGKAIDEYLKVEETASVAGSSLIIDDIEVLRASAPDNFTGGYPRVVQYYTDAENAYSASIEFNKWMDAGSFHDKVALTYDDESLGEVDVDSMQIWLGRNLHLVFDTNTDSDSFATEPLLWGGTYQLALDGDALDSEGYDLAMGMAQSNLKLETSFTLRPEEGWFPGQTEPVEGITDGAITKRISKAEVWSSELHKWTLLEDAEGLHHRVEFSTPRWFEGHLQLVARDARDVNWNNVESQATDGENVWLRQEGFLYDVEGNRYYQRWHHDSSGNQIFDEVFGTHLHTMDAVIVDDAGQTVSEVTYSWIPEHRIDLSGNRYIENWHSGQSTYTNVDTDEVFTWKDGYYFDSVSGTEYHWRFEAWRDADGNTWDDSTNIEWIDGGYFDQANERVELKLEWVWGYYIDDEGNRFDMPSTQWLNEFYVSDLNQDNQIDYRGLLDVYGEVTENPEVVNVWQDNWEWAAVFEEDDFVISDNHWRYFAIAKLHHGRQWMSVSREQDWWEHHDYFDQDIVAQGWLKHVVDFRDNGDGTATVVHNIYDSEFGEPVLSDTRDDVYIGYRDVSGRFTFDMLVNGDIELDNVKVYDVIPSEGETVEPVLDEAFTFKADGFFQPTK